MTEQTFTLDEVRAAFQTLEDHVAKQGGDQGCTWAIHWAAEDVLGILAGEWAPEGDEPDKDELDEDELRNAALQARTAETFDAAVLRLLGTLDDRPTVEKARIDVDAAWRPSPAGNEAMLEALEVFSEKLSGAMGRGASRTEAWVFAFLEARRVYQRASKE